MGKVFPPFKIDIAGALCVPSALRDARSRYRDGQISLQTLRAVEDAEIRNLTERLKSAGMKVATDGGFRSYDFLEGWEGIRRKTNTALSSGGELEVTVESVCFIIPLSMILFFWWKILRKKCYLSSICLRRANC